MAHYAYKHACYDIDYEKYKELVARFEQETGCEHNGDSNYDGDNWYIVEMWILELREKVKEQETEITSLRDALQTAIWRLKDMLEGDDGQAWKEAEKALPKLEATLLGNDDTQKGNE